MRNFFLVAVVLLLTMSGCKKYPEGPGLSFRSKKARLCQDWKLEQYIYDGNDYTDHLFQTFDTYEMNISKNGSMYLFTSTYMQSNGTTHTVQVNGTWEFSDDKRTLYFWESSTVDNQQSQPIAGGVRHTYQILKLYEKEFAIQENLDGHTNKYYFNRN